MTPSAETQLAQRELSRQLMDHPGFNLVQGMLVQFRTDDGVWTAPRRFKDFAEFGILPAYVGVLTPESPYRARFNIVLSDYVTAAALLRMHMEEIMKGHGGHMIDGWLNDDLGVVAATALLAAWATSSR
jgi:hypothetical protein